MREPDFFTRAGPFALGELARAAGAAQADVPDMMISDIAPLSRAVKSDLSFMDDRKQREALANSGAGACLIKAEFLSFVPAGMTALIVAEPARARALITGMFYPQAVRPHPMDRQTGISPAATVAPEARLEADVIVEPGARISPLAEIGEATVIGAGAIIGPKVRIGRGCYIGPNAVIQHALIGNGVIIHPGAFIGQDGFGYVMSGRGHQKIPQVGRVVIQDNVEIGAATTIDRGALDDTIVGEGSKIDNQVQIGHNVVIGRHCVIAAKVGISGSCKLGDFVAIGGGAGLADHLTIGPGARIGAAAGLMHDIPAGETWLGAPAKPVRTFFREVAALSKLAAPGKTRPARGGETGHKDE